MGDRKIPSWKRVLTAWGAAILGGTGLGMIIHTRNETWGLPETVALSQEWESWALAVVLFAAAAALFLLNREPRP